VQEDRGDMQRLRGSWLALLGAALLVLFSVSVAMGSDPATNDNRGQSIAGFVHSLIFGEETPDEVTTGDEADEEEDEAAEDEETSDEDAAEEEEQDGDVSGAEHGACVSEIAQSDEVGGENDNHGGAVSEAARETCWEDPSDEETTDPEDEQTEEFRNHGECVSEVAHSDEVGGTNDNHGGAVSEAARETCHEDGDEEATETSVTSEGAVLGRGHGNGKGHGNRP
jgi:hypothetical protein